MHKLGENLGRFFEVGFNIGILTYIEQKKLPHRFGELFRHELAQLKLSRMMRVLWKQAWIIDEVDRENLERWVIYFVWRGVLTGFHFFREYLETHSGREVPEVLYFQGQFCNENSLNTYRRDEEEAWGEGLSQLGLGEAQVRETIGRYQKKGEFLRADTLVWLGYRGKRRILVLDLSIFSTYEMRALEDLNQAPLLRRLLMREIGYLRSKSVFADLSFDMSPAELFADGEVSLFAEGLAHFYKAFIREDKESAKLIQAGGYAYSFYSFLEQMRMLDEKEVKFNVFGVSDRGISALTLGVEQVGLLRTCQRIYQHKAPSQEILEARRLVLETITSQAGRAFTQRREGRAFLKQLLRHDYRDGLSSFSFEEQIAGFVNSAEQVPDELLSSLELPADISMRDGHAELITRALAPASEVPPLVLPSSQAASLPAVVPYLFLTGNPGIGKTTAIVKFLKAHRDEGFLFLYVSPRTQVNLDIMAKFRQEDGSFCDDRLLLLNSTSDLIQRYGGREYTVHYFSNTREGEFAQAGVRFVDGEAEEGQRRMGRSRLQRKTEVLIRQRKSVNRGVLASVCEALHVVVSEELANQVVATVSIQSLQKTTGGKDTLRHLERIFKSAYNRRERVVLSDKLEAMAQRMRHLVIMVDEITGDESGVAFLDGIRRILKKLDLLNPRYGFNTKVIVADASIVDPEVITQHLSTTEPERDKIFFRQASTGVALSQHAFTFNKQKAIVINANSYPASELNLTYRILIEVFKYNANAFSNKRFELEEKVQAQMMDDLLALYEDPNSDQIIIYIQNKRLLSDMITQIGKIRKQQQKSFVEQKDYVQIHSNLSEAYKKALEQHKNEVKVVFMTSSASRGLSFPNARHLLIAVPSFALEQNLMEIIQVIYRGRGIEAMDRKPKTLIFYLAEQAIYAEEDYERSIQERLLNLINLLLILKTSIMTRIQGYGQIGRERYLMVPVGGKAVSSVGDSFSSRMAALLRELRQEQYKNPADVALRQVHKHLHALLQRSEVRLHAYLAENQEQPASYIHLLHHFEKEFVATLKRGFDYLLTLPPFEPAYINGSLLIIPLANRQVDESYTMRLWEQLMPAFNADLERQMWGIASNRQKYPDSFRTSMYQALEFFTLLKESNIYKSQYLQHTRKQPDLYLAIPLFAFISHKALATYFASHPEEPENQTFRDLLSAYLRTHYSTNGMLPIGRTYEGFPFVLFRSYSLKQIRRRLFTERQLLTSKELSVLNLILSGK